LIEPDPALRNKLKDMIRRADYDVVDADQYSTGAEAVSTTTGVDVVVIGASIASPGPREALQMLVLNLCAEVGLTVVLVTHSIEEAAFVGQKILLLGAPPTREAQSLDNPHAAGDAYRRSEDYHTMCALLRERIGDG